LYKDFNVPFATEGHKHCREGWVNTTCPFCTGNPGMHLGYNMADNYYVCWRCGWKATHKALALLIHVSEKEAKEIARKYGGKSHVKSTVTVRVGQKKFRLPPSTAPMNDRHKRYLTKRKFDPEVIEKIWDVQGTGPISLMDGISFSHRLVIPIYWENRIVSFQTRDITAKHSLRYITCPEQRERIKHKHIFYKRSIYWENRIVSFQTRDITAKHSLRYITCPEQRERIKHKHIFYQAIPTKDSDACICVEGVTDAWRFGYGAIATFGIKYTKYQVREISKRFKKVFVVFDDDPQAIKQSEKLTAELILRGVDAYSIKIQGDPGDMAQTDADALKKELLGWV